MIVTIIGTGNTAHGIGTRLVDAGHIVTLPGDGSKKAEALAEELRARTCGRRGDASGGLRTILEVQRECGGPDA